MSHYQPHTETETRAMLDQLGLSSVNALFKDVPEAVQLTKPLPLAKGLSQMDTLRAMEKLARELPVFLK